MPSFSYSAALRIDNPSLVIETTHFLVHDLPSETTHTVYGSVPTDVDVLLASDLVITISGTLDRVRLSSMDISKSAVALHLKRYLETNSGLLGLNAVSNLYVDETDDVTKLQSILDKAVEKLVKWHFVRRYPLIFGLWHKKLDAEQSFFAPIARSIINIVERSEDDCLANKCRRLLKSIAKNNRRSFRSSSESFHSYLQNAAITLESCCEQDARQQDLLGATDEEMFSFAMEKLFRLGVPQKMFKGSASACSARQPEDEEFRLINEPLSDDVLSTQSPSSMLSCEDLPIPGQFDESESHNRAQLLRDHTIDEYFLDDEVNWNQDDSGIWLWETTDSSLQLGSGEEHDSCTSDLDELPLPVFQGSPSTPFPHYARISKHCTPEPDQDLYYSDQSQEDAVMIHDSHNASPVHSAGLNTCRESAPFPLLASQDRVASAEFCSHSGSDVGIVCDLEEDLGPPFDDDEDEVILCEMSAVGDSEEAFSIWEDW
ncbi:hypothetical protein FIBSPDRAFT_925697 [Athelia psychrophila]|uniref:Uncharacterized protein n=1 Tax=Athelia psychrophila TaxID=1759441 RepID=A0A166U8B7_9AGAM|nr:hypothetical protein FIBSPDRAFT_925697 [Fibularhizoctonia sp. CBS 109695]